MRKARDSQDSSHHIVGESLLTVSEGTAAKLPKLDSLKRTIHRQRVQPTSLEELVLPAEYQQTAKGEQFLLYYSEPVGCHHPTIWKFIAALKREQGLVEVRQAKFTAGSAPTKRRSSASQVQSRRGGTALRWLSAGTLLVAPAPPDW